MEGVLGCIPKGGENNVELESDGQGNLEIHCGGEVIKLGSIHGEIVVS